MSLVDCTMYISGLLLKTVASIHSLVDEYHQVSPETLLQTLLRLEGVLLVDVDGEDG